MKPAAVNAIFPPAAAQMNNVKFRYVDNVLHEPVFMEGCVSASGNGKGYLDPMIEAIICFLRRHDEESSRKLEDWSRLEVYLERLRTTTWIICCCTATTTS